MTASISPELIDEVLAEFYAMPPEEALMKANEITQEQPALAAFLLATDEEFFNEEEQEYIHYIGMNLWQIMRKSPRRLGWVTQTKLLRAQDANLGFLTSNLNESDEGFVRKVKKMFESYPEPDVLGYLLESIMYADEDPDDPDAPVIREDVKGLAFLHLKTALDAMIRSLLRK